LEKELIWVRVYALFSGFACHEGCIAIRKDFTFMQHLVNAVATLATKPFEAIDGVQGEIGGFYGQAAKIAGFDWFFSHLASIV
jgi:hypothetical protein